MGDTLARLSGYFGGTGVGDAPVYIGMVTTNACLQADAVFGEACFDDGAISDLIRVVIRAFFFRC